MGGGTTIQDEAVPLLSPEDEEKGTRRKEFEIAGLIFLVVGFGSMNRVFSKIMTEPMANYSFFLSLFNGFAYVIFYGGILAVRYLAGKVTKKSLLFPFRVPEPTPHEPMWCSGGGFWRLWDKMWGIKYFIFIGFLDGLGNILGTIANSYISGIMGSLATQCMLLFAMPSAMIMLGTRYTIWQVLAAFTVLLGALVAVVPDLFQSSDNGPVAYIFLMAISNLPNAISFTIKELIFKKEKNLELFVVNTMGSLFQLLWWPLMVPITLLLHQTRGLPLMTYVHYGFMCFTGHTPKESSADCGPMPYPYIAYISVNVLFNVSLLMLLKRASALQGFMAVKAILPASVFLFLIKWPLIGKNTLTIDNTVSLLIILTGLALYRWASFEKERAEKLAKSI